MTNSIEPLDDLLSRAQNAGPSDRILLRDPIAAHGDAAIDAMADWLADDRLAAFAVRVLERVGREPAARDAVIGVLAAVDRSELSPGVVGDVERALGALGPPPRSTVRGGARAASSRPASNPGVPGRGYWVMRTSPWERPYVWAEAQRGRLRQGWGSTDTQNLDLIAEIVRRGGPLDEDQRLSWRSRRMRTAAHDGMRLGDLVVTPNLPEWGRLSVFRVTGSYRYELAEPRQWGERFGHILPVELVRADVDRRSPLVSDGLRAMLRPQVRLYNISGHGGDVERLAGEDASAQTSDRWGELWTERDYERLFGQFPPTGERPSDEQVAMLAAELGRAADAISWQWNDGRAYCAGGTAATTSEPLKAWLDRTGACR